MSLTLDKGMMTPTVLLRSELLRYPNGSDTRHKAIALYTLQVTSMEVLWLDEDTPLDVSW
jgi:hypothetical protein